MTENPMLPGQEKTEERGSNWLPLLILLLLVVPLRGWLMWNTEVLARDSVVYINYALEIERLSWKDALMSNHQHPGYPLAIWAVSLPVRHYVGPADSFTMQLSAQIASNLAAVLLIFPMYFLGRFFFERRVAFWGTLLFQYLPASGQALSDGVSESLFLLLISSAFLCSLWALRRKSTLLFIACGLFCGLSYLTRPEGVLVLVSTLLVLAVGPLLPFWRQSWRFNFRAALAMTLAGLAVGSLYFGFTHTFSRKPNFSNFLNTPALKILADSGTNESGDQPGAPLFAATFASSVEVNQPLWNRIGKGMYTYGAECVQIFHVGILALLVGAYWRFAKLISQPEFLVPCFFTMLQSSLLIVLAVKAGYLSNRHLLGVSLWGAFFTAAGFCDVPTRLGQWWLGQTAALLRAPRLARMSLLLLLAFVGLGLPRTAQKLHANQKGNHEAGLWLAKNFKKGDFICDDHNWTLFYAGQIFDHSPGAPAGREAKSFVVITRGRDPKVQQKQAAEEADLRKANGTIVYHWPESSPPDQARIVIYAVDRQGNQDRWWNLRKLYGY